ncbi:hypothetical protein TWF281_003695 [Arthrobotrys megalospora]
MDHNLREKGVLKGVGHTFSVAQHPVDHTAQLGLIINLFDYYAIHVFQPALSDPVYKKTLEVGRFCGVHVSREDWCATPAPQILRDRILGILETMSIALRRPPDFFFVVRETVRLLKTGIRELSSRS